MTPSTFDKCQQLKESKSLSLKDKVCETQYTQVSQPHSDRSIDLLQNQDDQHVEDNACSGDGHPHTGLGFRIRVEGPHT